MPTASTLPTSAHDRPGRNGARFERPDRRRPTGSATAGATEGDLVIPLRECRRGNEPQVGTKAADLGELLAAGLDVPRGFAVTSLAHARFLEENGLDELLQDTAAKLQDGDLEAASAAATAFRAAMDATSISWDLAAALSAAYRELCLGAGNPDNCPVAVRVSLATPAAPATPHDATMDPHAFDAYLNLQGADAVVQHVRTCWASHYTAQTLLDARRQGARWQPHLAVLVQRLANAESCARVRPQTTPDGRPGLIVESTFGLGTALIDRRLVPDRFHLAADDLAILARHVGRKPVELLPGSAGILLEEEVPPGRCDAPSLTDHQAQQVARVALAAQERLGRPHEVELAIEPRSGGRRLLVVRCRPLSHPAPPSGTGPISNGSSQALPAPDGSGLAGLEARVAQLERQVQSLLGQGPGAV